MKNSMTIEQTKLTMDNFTSIGGTEEQAALRCVDINFVMRTTGLSFEKASFVCYDTMPGFTDEAGFKTGWELCSKLVWHQENKKEK